MTFPLDSLRYAASVLIQITKTEIPSLNSERAVCRQNSECQKKWNQATLWKPKYSCVVVSSKFVFIMYQLFRPLGPMTVTQDWTPAKMQVPLCSSVTRDLLSEAEMSLMQAVLHQQLILPFLFLTFQLPHAKKKRVVSFFIFIYIYIYFFLFIYFIKGSKFQLSILKSSCVLILLQLNVKLKWMLNIPWFQWT